MYEHSELATETVATLQYMAPESMAKSFYSKKSDIYSLGILAFEILSEKPAYGSLEGFDLINNVANKGFRPDLSQLSSKYQEEVLTLIGKCLHQEPEKRPSASQICKTMIKLLKSKKSKKK
jgi:serine/threonine protein kinase